MNSVLPNRAWTFISLLIAMVFLTLQNNSSAAEFLPNWPWLVMMFWVLTTPHKVNIGSAFIVGLLCDSLLAQPIGLFALLFSLSAYFMTTLSAHYKGLPIIQQSLYIGLFYGLFQLCLDVFSYASKPENSLELNLWPVGLVFVFWGAVQYSLERLSRPAPIE